MPFAGYKDFADCVAKNQDKDDPDAYCGKIKHQVEHQMRHPDFDKIYQQFLSVTDGEQRYWDWIHALDLDETRRYADSRREQFRWVQKHADFRLWKEDADAKYWKFEAGFPVESMNENVYSAKELELAARTLIGKTASLNHKYDLDDIPIVAAEYEGGVVEGVLRVPLDRACPICPHTNTVNDLIAAKGIVNVSLEAYCAYSDPHDTHCEGMVFTGLSLLTKDVLPGIPMTRLMPLEHIMREALQPSHQRGKNMKGKKTAKRKIEMKIVEQARTDVERAKAHFHLSDEDWTNLSAAERHAYIDKLPPRGTKEQGTGDVVVGPKPEPKIRPDAKGQCPDGMKATTIGGTGEEPECVPITDEDKAQQVHQSIEPDLAQDVKGTPATPSPTMLTSGPTYGHQGTPTLSTITPAEERRLLKKYEVSDEPYQQCMRDQKAAGFNDADAENICKALKPTESAKAGQPGDVPPKPKLTWPKVSPDVDADPTILQAGDPAPKPSGHTDPVQKAGTPKPHDTIAVSDVPAMPPGDTTMHPTEPGTMTPKSPKDCGPDHHWDAAKGDCMPNAPIVEQETHGDTPGSPQCEDGYHWDPEIEDCVPDEPAVEMVRRIKAETKAAKLEKNMELVEATWEAKYTQLVKAYNQSVKRGSQLKGSIETLTTQNNRLSRDLVDAQVERDKWRSRRDEVAGTRDDLQRQLDKVQVAYEEISKKYHASQEQHVKNIESNNQRDMDWLKLNRENQELKDALSKARNLAKKTLKIKL